MDTINDRMELLINQCFEGNKAAFAKTIGLPPTGLSNYLGNKRRSKPSVDMVAKIVQVLDVDARWLLTGEESQEAAAKKNDGSVAVSDNATAHHFSTNVISGGDAIQSERIKCLEALLKEKDIRIAEKDTLLAEKERVIRVYERALGK